MSPTTVCWMPLSVPLVPLLLLLLLKIKQAEQVASGERPPGYFDAEQEYPEGEEDEFEEVTVSSDTSAPLCHVRVLHLGISSSWIVIHRNISPIAQSKPVMLDLCRLLYYLEWLMCHAHVLCPNWVS